MLGPICAHQRASWLMAYGLAQVPTQSCSLSRRLAYSGQQHRAREWSRRTSINPPSGHGAFVVLSVLSLRLHPPNPSRTSRTLAHPRIGRKRCQGCRRSLASCVRQVIRREQSALLLCSAPFSVAAQLELTLLTLALVINVSEYKGPLAPHPTSTGRRQPGDWRD